MSYSVGDYIMGFITRVFAKYDVDLETRDGTLTLDNVPIIHINDDNIIDVGMYVKNKTQIDENELIKYINEKTSWLSNRNFVIEWLEYLIESRPYIQCNDFCELFFNTVLPNFLPLHDKYNTRFTTFQVYTSYDLEMVSLIKTVLKRSVDREDIMPDDCSLQELVCAISMRKITVFNYWGNRIGSLFSNVAIDLLTGSIMLEYIPYNLIPDIKSYMLTHYTIAFTTSNSFTSHGRYLEDRIRYSGNTLKLDFLTDFVDDTYEYMCIVLRILKPLLVNINKKSVFCDIVDEILSTLCVFLEKDKEVNYNAYRRDYYRNVFTLKNTFYLFFKTIYEARLTWNETTKVEGFLLFFDYVFNKMYQVGHSSIRILESMKVISEIDCIKIDVEKCGEWFKFEGEKLIKWKELPEYFRLYIDYHSLLQGIKTYDDILTCDQIYAFQNDFSPKIKSKLNSIAICITRIRLGLVDRKTFLDLRSMLNYNMNDYEILDDIEGDLDLYMNTLGVNPIGIITLLLKTKFNCT